MFEAPKGGVPRPDSQLPQGTIAVTVRDAGGAPVANAAVVLGVMSAQSERTEKPAKTDATGLAQWTGLGTGSAQAYRVNYMHKGAKISSTPFRLPPGPGYRVELHAQPTTQDPRMVFQMMGQTVVELRDDRLHVSQQARLTNAGQEIYVLPKGGQLVKLPEGFISLQLQKVMTDQKLREVEGQGVRVEGSLPPGTVTLGWTFDIKHSGDTARMTLDVPWRTYMYRVLSEAPEGVELRVTGMPDPERIRDGDRDLLMTQLQRRPDDPQLSSISLRLTGIPAPGPGRWFAVALAVLALLFGLWAVIKPGEGEALRRARLPKERERLVAEAKALAAQRESGEIGPEFHASEFEKLATELASVLRDEELLGGAAAGAAAGGKQG